jgi:hypothetical protein
MCGLAVPASIRPDGIPFSVSLLAPAGDDAALAAIGREFHAATGLPLGALQHPQPPLARLPAAPAEGEIPIAVVGAHLSGMPLNGELRAAGGRLIERTATAPHYRLYALAGTRPPKPGLLRVQKGTGAAIEVEVWAHSAASSPRCRLLSRSARSNWTAAAPSRASWSRPRRLQVRATFQASAVGAPSWRRRRRRRDDHFGSSMKLTCAATTRQPSGKRTQVCICCPILQGTLARRNSVDATA